MTALGMTAGDAERLGDTAIASLSVRDVHTRRLTVVGGLLDPANATLVGHLAGARRVLVVTSDRGQTDALVGYLDAQVARGSLDGYSVVTPVAEPDGTASLQPLGRLADAAVAAGLGRRDAFLAYGPGTGALVAATAAMFRRFTTAVQVVTDIATAWAVLGDVERVHLPGAVAVPRRQVTVLVDRDAVLASPHSGPEDDALRALARTDRPLAELLAAPADRIRLLTAAMPATVRRFGGLPSTVERPSAQYRTEPPVAYPVVAVRDVFGTGDRDGGLAAWLPPGGRVVAVVDRFSSRVARDVDRYLSGRREIVGHTVLPIVSGPSSKSLRRVDDVVRILDASGLGAGDRIVAVGGGTLLDLVGTAALVYRGRTPYLRVPTTLVGMIDAGIGLKVGVDVSQRKNLLGGYHPPLACLCDPAFLSTLPDRELRCGLAEATKIAMVVDRDLFELIERFHDHVLDRRDTTPVRQIIDGAIAAMLGELETNPYERDLRRRADFGHEFGHLLESASRFQLRHGEAVAIGMALSSQLGVLVGRQRAADHRRFVRLLTRIGLPTFHPLCEPARLWRWLREDVCAAKGGAPHLVVPTGIGSAGFVDSMDDLTPETVRLACSLLAGAGP